MAFETIIVFYDVGCVILKKNDVGCVIGSWLRRIIVWLLTLLANDCTIFTRRLSHIFKGKKLKLDKCNIDIINITPLFLLLFMFQGIWLCEHRDHPTSRRVVVTLNGI